jgi:predicted ATPase
VQVVESVLASSPTVTVLATSREALGIDGEQMVAVNGLVGDDLDAPAVKLFVDWARQVEAGCELGDGDAETVRELCRRLDGMPSAIGLAAASVGVLSPSELLRRIDERFGGVSIRRLPVFGR